MNKDQIEMLILINSVAQFKNAVKACIKMVNNEKDIDGALAALQHLLSVADDQETIEMIKEAIKIKDFTELIKNKYNM